MAYYSFVVLAPHPVGIPKPMVVLDKGVNTFSAVVDDLEKFRETLENEGVEIRQVNRLDEHEENLPSDLLLEGEVDDPFLPEV